MIFTLIFVRSERTEKKVLNISSDICDNTFRLISADKSDQFVPNVSNDIYIQILIFVRSERTETKILNISSDICDKSFRFISADKSDKFLPKISKVTPPLTPILTMIDTNPF